MPFNFNLRKRFITTPANNSGLPQEIVDLIIDEVKRSEPYLKDLCACALVSTAFNTSANRHLFRRITITYDVRAEARMARLRNLLEKNPRLLVHVRILTFWLGARGFPSCKKKSIGSRFTIIYGRLRMKLIETSNPEEKNTNWVLQRLLDANLKLLQITGSERHHRRPYYTYGWEDISLSVAKNLLAISQSNEHLNKIHIRNVHDIPASLLTRKIESNALTEFKVSNGIFDSPGAFFRVSRPGGDFAPQLLDNLRVLSLQYSLPIHFEDGIYRELPILRFPKLEYLSTSIGTWPEHIVLLHLLRSHMPVLKTLRLIVHGIHLELDPLFPAFIPNNLVSLERLVLKNGVKAFSEFDIFRYTKEMFEVLQYPRFPPTIETISFDFSIMLEKRSRKRILDGLVWTLYAYLGRIDELLCAKRARYYPMLAKMEVQLHIYGPQRSEEWCSEYPYGEDVFPGLAGHGVVTHVKERIFEKVNHD